MEPVIYGLAPDYIMQEIVSVYPHSTDPVMDTIVGLIAFVILEGAILFMCLQNNNFNFRLR
jgi:hypothetical protein